MLGPGHIPDVNVHGLKCLPARRGLDAAGTSAPQEHFGTGFNLNVLQVGAAWTFHFLLDIESGHGVF